MILSLWHYFYDTNTIFMTLFLWYYLYYIIFMIFLCYLVQRCETLTIIRLYIVANGESRILNDLFGVKLKGGVGFL